MSNGKEINTASSFAYINNERITVTYPLIIEDETVNLTSECRNYASVKCYTVKTRQNSPSKAAQHLTETCLLEIQPIIIASKRYLIPKHLAWKQFAMVRSFSLKRDNAGTFTKRPESVFLAVISSMIIL